MLVFEVKKFLSLDENLCWPGNELNTKIKSLNVIKFRIEKWIKCFFEFCMDVSKCSAIILKIWECKIKLIYDNI